MFRTIGLYAVLGLGSLMAACTEAVDEGAIIDEDALSVTEQAVGSCGTHGNYFDGAKNGVGSGVYRRGARVDAIVRNTALCTGDPSIANFSAGWAMLTGDIAPSDGWAQIGFEVDKANGNTWFLQSLRDSSKGPHTECGCQPVDSMDHGPTRPAPQPQQLAPASNSSRSPCHGLFHHSTTSISLRNRTKSSSQWLGS